MRILKHGKTYSKTQCENCGCRFEYHQTEVCTIKSADLGMYQSELDLIKCPECNTQIILDERVIEI